MGRFLALTGRSPTRRPTPSRQIRDADTGNLESSSRRPGGEGTEETGYAYGLRFEYPFMSDRESSPAIRIHAGGTYNHLEFENADGDQVADSDHGVGWEPGAGVAFPVGDAWKITPGARFRSLSRDVTVADVTTDVDLRYIAADVAVSWSFGS